MPTFRELTALNGSAIWRSLSLNCWLVQLDNCISHRYSFGNSSGGGPKLLTVGLVTVPPMIAIPLGATALGAVWLPLPVTLLFPVTLLPATLPFPFTLAVVRRDIFGFGVCDIGGSEF